MVEVKGLDVGDGLLAERLENGASGGEAVCDPVGLSVAGQRGSSFSSTDVHFDSSVGHPFELSDEFAGSAFEGGFFEESKDTVVERDCRSVMVQGLLLVEFEESADGVGLVGSSFWSDVKLGFVVGDGGRGAAILENEVDGQHEFDVGFVSLAEHACGLFDSIWRNVNFGLSRVGCESDAEFSTFVSCGGGFQRECESTGGDDHFDGSTLEDLFEVIEFVDLDPAEDDEVGLSSAAHVTGKFLADVLSQRDLLATERHERTREVPVRGAQCLVDVDSSQAVGDAVDVVGEPGSHLGDGVLIGGPESLFERVSASIFENGDGTIGQFGHSLCGGFEHTSG